MKLMTKTQFMIEALKLGLVMINKASAIMMDADVSSTVWAEIKGIENNLGAVIKVMEVNEDASE